MEAHQEGRLKEHSGRQVTKRWQKITHFAAPTRGDYELFLTVRLALMRGIFKGGFPADVILAHSRRGTPRLEPDGMAVRLFSENQL